MRHKKLAMILCTISLFSCANNNSSNALSGGETSSSISESSWSRPSRDGASFDEGPIDVDFEAPITLLTQDKTKEKDFSFHFSSEYFQRKNSQVDDEMMMFSYALACASKDERRAFGVYDQIGFTQYYDDSTLSEPKTEESIGYVIGARDYEEATQVIISIRGEEYGLEWVSNMYAIPEEESAEYNGDHYGMHLAAKKVYEGIKSFVKAHQIKRAKYLLTGYSRAGAVAGLASAMLVDNPVSCTSKDIYAYTFEAPAAMAKENNKEEYEIIHNFINENDMIPFLLPSQYGYVLPGTTINIANGIDEYGPLFEELGLPAIKTTEEDFARVGFVNENGKVASGKEFFGLFVDVATRQLSEEEKAKGLVSYQTKEEYRDNLQPYLMELMRLIFNEHFEPKNVRFIGLLRDIAGFFANLVADDGFEQEGGKIKVYDPYALRDIIHKILTQGGLKPASEMGPDDEEGRFYDPNLVDQTCDGVQAMLRNLQLGFTRVLVDQGKPVNSARGSLLVAFVQIGLKGGVLNRHAYDTTYVVLRHYLGNKQAA